MLSKRNFIDEGMTSINPFLPSKRFSQLKDYYTFYVDSKTKRLYCKDATANKLVISLDNGVTFSSDKGFPAETNNFGVMYKWKNDVYLITRENGEGKWASIWKSPDVSGDELYTWVKVHQLSSFCTMLKTSPDGNDKYIYAGEYSQVSSDVGKANKIWRSLDGVSWTLCYDGSVHNTRHIHSVKCDPYKKGWVWASIGDAGLGATAWIILSKDYGGTWSVINNDSQDWQAVQISFTKDYVYLSNDFVYAYSSVAVIRREDMKVMYASKNSHRTIAVPGGNEFSQGYELSAVGSTDISSNGRNRFCISCDFDKNIREIVLDISKCNTGINIASEMQSKIRILGGVYNGIVVEFIDNKYKITSPTKGIKSGIRVTPSYTPYSEDCTELLKIGRFRGASQFDGKSIEFGQFCYWGIVDSETGIYYTVSHDLSSNQVYGLFYLDKVGGDLRLLEVLPNDFDAGQEMFISDRNLIWGCYKRPLLNINND